MVSTTAPGATITGMRTCAGCRRKAHRSDLVRMVVDRRSTTPVVVVDPRAVLPGRGVWLHPQTDCLDHAETRRAIQRGLRISQSLPLDEVRAWFDLQHTRRSASNSESGQGRWAPDEHPAMSKHH